MEKTNIYLVFKWFEHVWAQGDKMSDTHLSDVSSAEPEDGVSLDTESEVFRRVHPGFNEELADIQLDFESFMSDGDRVTCAMVAKARNKVSGERIAFRSLFDGRVKDGRLVNAA